MLLAFLVVRKITPLGLPCFFDTSLRLFSDQPITVSDSSQTMEIQDVQAANPHRFAGRGRTHRWLCFGKNGG
jgi:hypothetical protein